MTKTRRGARETARSLQHPSYYYNNDLMAREEHAFEGQAKEAARAAGQLANKTMLKAWSKKQV